MSAGSAIIDLPRSFLWNDSVALTPGRIADRPVTNADGFLVTTATPEPASRYRLIRKRRRA